MHGIFFEIGKYLRKFDTNLLTRYLPNYFWRLIGVLGAFNSWKKLEIENPMQLVSSVVDPKLFFFGSGSDLQRNFGSGSSSGSDLITS